MQSLEVGIVPRSRCMIRRNGEGERGLNVDNKELLGTGIQWTAGNGKRDAVVACVSPLLPRGGIDVFPSRHVNEGLSHRNFNCYDPKFHASLSAVPAGLD